MVLQEKLEATFPKVLGSSTSELRKAAFEVFQKEGFPSKKEEAWKYTSLNKVLKVDYTVLPQIKEQDIPANLESYFLDALDSYRVVFLDGVFEC